MDLSADSGTLPTHTTGGGPAMEQELSLSNTCCQTESGGTILLQLLEFKTHLLEAVEELHIRRDAETRFEDQISKLVLEKQELEWEKESLQHQNDTVLNQQTDSLIKVKNELQAKIRNIEEQKAKYQVSAELKDKEINNLKEELKSLQLLKYNLEKRSSELEQKLSLQSRSKDSHLNQLGEVEKRFGALSRQCATVKQAHEKLEQNVDEAVKIQKKLTTANEKQEATIVSLKKELEEVSHKLIKAKMSSVRHGEAHSAAGREQHCEQLHRKLSMETEMNQKLREENVSARAEKQMRDGGQSPGVPTEDIRGEGTLNEPISSSELPLSFGSLQHLASAQTSNPDGLEDTGVVTERDATGATGVSFVLSHYHMCVDGSVDLLSKEQSDEGNGGRSEREQGWKHDEGQQRNGKGEDVKEGGGAAEKRGTLGPQTTERAARREGCPGSTEDAGGPKRPEAAPEDRAEGEGTHGAEERGKTGLRAAETQIAQTTTDTMAEKSDTQPAVDLMDTELAACEPSDRSQSLLQSVGEEDAASSRVMEGHETPSVLCRSDEHRGVDDWPNCVAQEAQSLCHDAVQTLAESVTPSPIHHVLKPTEEKPYIKSAANMSPELSGSRDQSGVWCSQISTAPSAAKSDGVSLQESATTQTRPGDPSDIPSDMKQTDASRPSPEISQQSGPLKSLVAEDDGDSSVFKGQSNVDTQGNNACETQKPTAECTLKNARADATGDAAGLETGSRREIDGAGDAKMTKSDPDSQPPVHPSHESDATPETGGTKCYERSQEMLPDDAHELPLLGNASYRSSFDWCTARGRTGSSRDTVDVSVPHQFVQGSPASEQNTSGPRGLLRHPPGTIPTFLKSKHSKVPLVVTRASDLLNASVSGATASTVRHRQGGRDAPGESAAADTESGVSLSLSTSSPVSRLLWQAAPGSLPPTSDAGPSSESNWEPFCSQEKEDQQSSFRAQISKIEHFLNTERLRLTKRRRTDN